MIQILFMIYQNHKKIIDIEKIYKNGLSILIL